MGARPTVQQLISAGAMSSASFERVGGTVTCVVTRFTLRSAIYAPMAYWLNRRVRRQAATVKGLLVAKFFREGLRTFYSISLWEDDHAIVAFNGTCRAHVGAANWVFKVCAKLGAAPEVWSTQYQLAFASRNLAWNGLDLRAVLSAQMGIPADRIASGRLLRHE
jgi:hypothetical protein